MPRALTRTVTKKGSNILLSAARDRAYLSDFGVSRHFDTMDLSRERTISPETAQAQGGSSAYLSPEQLSENEQSSASDIYAFGLVVYELLTGRLPYDPKLPLFRQMEARVHGRLTEPREVVPGLDGVVASNLMRALDPKPSNRPVSAGWFVTSLLSNDAWDVFIAYPKPDLQFANDLYELLSPRHRVFMDCRSVELGDDWDETLRQAQANSTLTVVVVSVNSGKAYYAREEIANAIAASREQPESRRVIPIFLDALSAANPPYGLRLKHGIVVETADDIAVAAIRIDSLLARRGRA